MSYTKKNRNKRSFKEWNWDWTRSELEYWYLKLLFWLKLSDSYHVFRPYHIWRMISDDIKPLFPEGHEIHRRLEELYEDQ